MWRSKNKSFGLVSAAICLVAGLAISGQGLAQSSKRSQPTLSAPGVAQNASSRFIKLAINKARILELPTDVADVLVANAGIADIVVKTPRRIYLLARRIGTTNAFFFDLAGREVFRAEIEVHQDVVGIEKSLDDLIPDNNIVVVGVRDNVFLKGSVRSAETAEWARIIAARHVGSEANVISMLSVVEDQQVMLQVRVAEASRTVLKSVGINLFNAVTGLINTFTSGDLVATVAAGVLGTSYGRLALSYQNSSGDTLALTIQALEQNGLLKVLAEPNLTAISGETATFHAGGEFPIPVSQSNSDNITVEFRPFGVELAFTPVVLNSGRISLRIRTEISDISNRGAIFTGAFRIPGRSIRRAESTVELPSGGSMMMAGLIQSISDTNVEGVPGLKDIPLLGALFRQNQTETNENELIIVVTATLVKPITRRRDVASPIDNIAPPSDYDLYALGRIQSRFGVPGNHSLARDLKGPIGYIVK